MNKTQQLLKEREEKWKEQFKWMKDFLQKNIERLEGLKASDLITNTK